MPLTLGQLDGIFGAPLYSGWADSRLTCRHGLARRTRRPLVPWANLDPTMENFALMSLLDSTTASQAAFKTALTTAVRSARR